MAGSSSRNRTSSEPPTLRTDHDQAQGVDTSHHQYVERLRSSDEHCSSVQRTMEEVRAQYLASKGADKESASHTEAAEAAKRNVSSPGSPPVMVPTGSASATVVDAGAKELTQNMSGHDQLRPQQLMPNFAGHDVW